MTDVHLHVELAHLQGMADCHAPETVPPTTEPPTAEPPTTAEPSFTG